METAGTAVLVSLLTLLIRDGVPAVASLIGVRGAQARAASADDRAARREEDAAERKQEAVAVKELKELVGVLRQNAKEDREQIHELRNQLQDAQNDILACQMDRTRMAERIRAFEDALDRAGIPFHRTDDSGAHTPLPPDASGRFRRAPRAPKSPDTPEGDQ